MCIAKAQPCLAGRSASAAAGQVQGSSVRLAEAVGAQLSGLRSQLRLDLADSLRSPSEAVPLLAGIEERLQVHLRTFLTLCCWTALVLACVWKDGWWGEWSASGLEHAPARSMRGSCWDVVPHAARHRRMLRSADHASQQ